MPPVPTSVELGCLLFSLLFNEGAKESERLRFDVAEPTFDVTPYSHSATAVLSAEAHSVEQHA